jgi:nucleotide-binding universal stress UspA family protein
MKSPPFQTVIVPTDFSEFSLSAIDVALRLVDDKKRIHVFHAQPNLTSYDGALNWKELIDDACVQAAKALREKLPGEKFEGVQVSVRAGDAGDEIAKYAQEVNADLIVMPSHGRRGFKRFMVGSVTERVVRLSPCDVLVLKVNQAS